MSIRKYEASLGEPLTEPQREVLENLIEEAAEVIKNATKLLRFGNEATNPLTGASNSYELGMEIGNLGAMVDLAIKYKLVIETDINTGMEQKSEKLSKWSRTLP